MKINRAVALSATAVLLVSIIVAYRYPRAVRYEEYGITLYYHGLGISDSPEWHGRLFDYADVDEFCSCVTRVVVHGRGRGKFETRRSNGSICGHGTCFVEYVCDPQVPIPDVDRVLQGKYFSQSGDLLSEVSDGTGKKIVVAAADGRRYEVQLHRGAKLRAALFDHHGERIWTHELESGKPED